MTDRSEIRRKALLAAATVTLAMGLPGCADGAKDDDAGGDTLVADTLVDTPRDTGLDTLVADTDVSDTQVSDTLVADTEVGAEPDCTAPGVDLGACCVARLAWCEAQVDTAVESVNECMYGPGFDGSTGCIPWGPPAPPRASFA